MVLQLLSEKAEPDPDVQEKYTKHREFLLLWREKLIKATDHPNLIHIQDVRRINNEIAIEYEHFDGIKLSEFLEQNKESITQKDIKSIITQLFEGLIYFHKEGFIHRDIRMDNIWISKGPPLQVAIGDFEIARYLSLPESKNTLGSALYAPPEQIKVDGVEGFYTDVCSLGRMLFYLLQKRNPNFNDIFDSRTFVGDITAKFGQSVFDTLCTATSSYINLRYKDLEEFKESLFLFLGISFLQEA